MANAYQEQIDDALESIKEAGKQFDFALTTVGNNPDKPWLGGTTTTTDVKMLACVFPVSSAPSALREPMLKQGTMIETQMRYVLAAGEGRTTHPNTGDVLKSFEGNDWAIMACAPLTVNGEAAIIYEMVVKR